MEGHDDHSDEEARSSIQVFLEEQHDDRRKTSVTDHVSGEFSHNGGVTRSDKGVHLIMIGDDDGMLVLRMKNVNNVGGTVNKERYNFVGDNKDTYHVGVPQHTLVIPCGQNHLALTH